MKAVCYYDYGAADVLQYEEVGKPIPKSGEVLIRLRAASANPLDWRAQRADPFFIRFMGSGLLRPKQNILGVDIAGTVEAVGANVASFEPGDEVFGASRYGGFAEFVCASEDRVVPKPETVSFEQAASVPVAAVTALQGLRDKGRLQPGQRVLITGASGGVGTFAVQIAKSLGANVTGVCSTRNLDLVRSLGADHVIDYTREDFTRTGERYDLIFDGAAYHSVVRCRHALRPDGTYVMVGGSTARMLQSMLLAPLTALTRKKIGFMVAQMNRKDLLFLKELLETGDMRPVIDSRYPLRETARALDYLEKGHARGKVVINMTTEKN